MKSGEERQAAEDADAIEAIVRSSAKFAPKSSAKPIQTENTGGEPENLVEDEEERRLWDRIQEEDEVSEIDDEPKTPEELLQE